MQIEIPAVSVIIPLYNGAAFVEQAVMSILRQTLADFECLIVDDGSTDGGYELCERNFADESRVQLFRNAKNSGLGYSRNYGLRMARGKYVAFLDADDVMLPAALETLVRIAEDFRADVVSCNAFLWSQDENIPEDFSGRYLSEKDSDYVQKPTFLAPDRRSRIDAWCRRKVHGNVWNKLYLRPFLSQKDIWFPEAWPMSEDWPFSLACLLHAKRYVRTPYQLQIYRNRQHSASRHDATAKHLEEDLGKQIRTVPCLADVLRGGTHQEETVAIDAKMDLVEANVLRRYYQNGLSPQIHEATDRTFRQFFGDYAPFVAYYFHRYHLLLRKLASLEQTNANF